MVAEVVRAVLATMSGDLSAQETSLLAEVEALGRTIASAKAEIAALRVDDITDNHIPFATDELDAIVEHTATATNAILSSCETLDDVAGSVTGEPAARLQDATTRIYEACSFQDITGQRITKVVATLKTIESKVAQIVATFGGGERAASDRSGCRSRRDRIAQRSAASRRRDGSVRHRQAAGQLRMRPRRSGLAARDAARMVLHRRRPRRHRTARAGARWEPRGLRPHRFQSAIANRLHRHPGRAARRGEIRRRSGDRSGACRAAERAGHHQRDQPGGARAGAGDRGPRLANGRSRGDRRVGCRRGGRQACGARHGCRSEGAAGQAGIRRAANCRRAGGDPGIPATGNATTWPGSGGATPATAGAGPRDAAGTPQGGNRKRAARAGPGRSPATAAASWTGSRLTGCVAGYRR